MRRWHGDGSVGEAAQNRWVVRTTCLQCTHVTHWCARGLLHVIPPKTKLAAIRFRCQQCGSTDIERERAYLEPKSGITPVYVIRFVGKGR